MRQKARKHTAKISPQNKVTFRGNYDCEVGGEANRKEKSVKG